MQRTWDDEDLESIANTIEAAKAAAWKLAKKLIDDLNVNRSLRGIGLRIGCTGSRLSMVRIGKAAPGINLLRKLAKCQNVNPSRAQQG